MKKLFVAIVVGLLAIHCGVVSADPLFFSVGNGNAPAPKIDGHVNWQEWSMSTPLPTLHDSDDLGRNDRNVQSSMICDQTNLYISFVINHQPDALERNVGKSSEVVYPMPVGNDRVRTFFRFGSGRTLEISGGQGHDVSVRIDGQTVAQSGVMYTSVNGIKAWEGEMSIPLSLISGSREFEFDLSIIGGMKSKTARTMAFSSKSDATDNLWRVRLSDSPVLMVAPLKSAHIKNGFSLLNTGAQPVKAVVAYHVESDNSPKVAPHPFWVHAGSPTESVVTIRPNERKNFEFPISEDNRQSFTVDYTATVDNQVVANGVFMVNADSNWRVEITPYFLKHEKIRCDVSCDDPQVETGNAVADIVLKDASSGEVYEETEAKIGKMSRSGHAFLNTNKLVQGRNYLVAVTVMDSGQVLAEETKSIERPMNPSWWGNKLGLSTQVPQPFSPISLTGNTVGLWQRSYEFGGSAFPKSITSRGQTLTSSPIKLVAASGGSILPWTGESLTTRETAPGRVVFDYQAHNAQVNLKASILCEYDGMIRYDLELSPVTSGASLDQLYLDIPIKKEFAKLYSYGYVYTDVEKAQAHDEKDISNAVERDAGISMGELKRYFTIYPNGRMPFCAGFYLGNDDRGIQWFAENDKEWSNKNEDEVIGLERRSEDVLMRVNFIDQGTSIDKPMKLTWGLITTPIRDTAWEQENVRTCPTFNLGSYILNSPKPIEQYNRYFQSCSDFGLKFMHVYHQMKGQFGAPKPNNAQETEAFKHMGADMAKHGLRYYYYGGWGVTPESEGLAAFGQEMMQEPRVSAGFDVYRFDLNSPYVDYYLDGAAYMMKNAGAGGVHLDSTHIYFNVFQNELDGYKFIKNGKVHGSWPIFASRNFAKRMYTMLNDGEVMPDRGLIHSGMSYPMYCVSGFLSARYAYEDLMKMKTLDDIRLDSFRLRCADVMNGVYCDFGWNNSPKIPLHVNEMVTLCVLHGIWMNCQEEEITSPKQLSDPYGIDSNPQGQLNMLYQTFGYAKAEFHPYYLEEGLANTGNPKVLATMYLYPGEKALVAVGNVSGASVNAAVSFDWNKLGIPADQAEVRDGLLPATVFDKSGDQYIIPIQSQRYRILVITRKK